MKVLVVGCGVIGSLLVHTLMQAGNEVSVVLRGRWKEVVETNGLRIHHVLQNKDTVDHPIVLSGPGEETYDLVFSVMQAEQQEEALTMLSGIQTDTLVLVGNNLHCAEIVEKIHAAAPEKRVLFGFQMSAGERKDTYVEVVRKGGGSMTVGCLHQEPEDEVKEKLLSAFSGTGYRLYWCDDMEGYLWTHAAFILPCVFLSYAHDCNMHHLSLSEIRQAVLAAKEGYRLIERAGMKTRPKEDEGYDTGKSWEILMTAMLTGMSRTKLSDLCITDHCRNAVDEMEDLTSCFETLRQQYPDVPMVHWDALQSSMPSFEILKEQYRKRKPDYANWMPKEMIAGAAAGSAALLAASAALHAAGRKSGSSAETLAGTVLSLGGAVFGGFTVYTVAARRAFSHEGDRKLSRDIIEGVADHVSIPDGGTCLDVGCGSGALSIACARRNPKGSVLGIDHWGAEYRDFSKELCESNARAEEVTNVSFQKGDAVKLDFPDGTFDVVTSNYVYHNIAGKNKQELLLETLRVLKDGGTFVIHDLMSNARYGDMDRFVFRLQEMGYEDVELIDTTERFFRSRREAVLLGLGDSRLLIGRKEKAKTGKA